MWTYGTPTAPYGPMQGLTGFQRDLLFVLCGLGSSDGMQVKRELERARYSSILPGRLYHNLDVLVEQSFVRKSDGDGRANEYRLTRRGHASLRDHHAWQRRYLDETVEEALSP